MLIETPSAARFGAGYREAATRPESSITLHVGKGVRAFAVLVPAFTLLLAVVVLLASEVSGKLRCHRVSDGLGTCVIDRHYVLSNAGARVPLENDVPTGFGGRALGLAALFGLSLVVAAIILSFEQRARVVLSEHQGAVRVEQRRFFFGRKTQSWPLESLVDAEMEEHRKTYRVRLVFKGNLAAPVIARFHRNEARHALVIDAIHEFLRREACVTADVGAVI